jgi:hypothetical protein
MQATGGTPPYAWTVASGSSLPSWLTLSATGALTGTPSATGTLNFSLTVTDSGKPTAQTKTQAFSLTVVSASAVCGTGNELALKGQYAFTLTGWNSPQGFMAVIGSFTADGNGHITAGTVDVNSLNAGVQSGSVTATGSSYSVGSDNRGCATIVTPFYTFTTRFALNTPAVAPATGGAIEEWETGSSAYVAVGKLVLQKGIPATLPAGDWVFEQTGVWYSTAACAPLCRTGVVGVITADGHGNFTKGEYDSSVLNITHRYIGLNGTYTSANATTGRFTEVTGITGSSTTINRVDYIVSPTQFLELVSDPLGAGAGHVALLGEGRLRSGSPTVSGAMAFYAAGVEASGGNRALLGVMTVNTSTSVLSMKVYSDFAGVWSTHTYACGYSLDSYGRFNSDPTGCPAFFSATYLSGPNTGMLLAFDGGVSLGELHSQSATTLTPGSYFFSTKLEAIQPAQETQVGVATINAGGITGTTDITSIGSPEEADQPFAETLTVNSDGTFSTSDNAGVISGIIISNSQIVLVGEQTSLYPTILLFSTTP